MRDIKFRVWIPSRPKKGMLVAKSAYMAVQGEPDIETLQSFMHHYGDQENIMQFTGLHDKSGKEIWEGDIVCCWDAGAEDEMWGLDYKHTGVIRYSPPVFVLAVKTGEKDVLIRMWDDAENIEIIGNIYEHPHLLTQ